MQKHIKSARTSRLLQSLMVLAVLSGCAAPQSKQEPRPTYSYKEPVLRPGIFAKNYVRLVEDTASWLAPTYFAGLAADTITTDDLERTGLEMIEKGYVMVGYSTVNTREAGIDKAGWIGSARDAAVWAGADVAVVKKDFSHTATVQVAAQVPLEVEQENLRTTGGSVGIYGDTTTSSGTETSDTRYQDASATLHRDSSNSGYRDSSRSSYRDDTRTSWQEEGSHWDIGGGLGIDKLFGPSASLQGGYGEHSAQGRSNATSVGNNVTSSRGSSRTVSSGTSSTGSFGQSGTSGQHSGESQTVGGSQQQFQDNTVRERTLWVAQLMDKEVDHYVHVVTFWRKVVPDPLGATTSDLPPELRRELQTNRGALVLGTVKDLPAYQADLLSDDVLLAFNDVRIRNTDHLYRLTRAHAGQTVELSRWRDGETTTVTVPLLSLDQSGPRRNGILEVEFADTKELDQGLRNYVYQHYRNAELEIDEGALIKRVYPASTAERKGLLPGDVVLEVSGERTSGGRRVTELLRRYRGQTVPIKFLRRGEPSTVQVGL